MAKHLKRSSLRSGLVCLCLPPLSHHCATIELPLSPILRARIAPAEAKLQPTLVQTGLPETCSAAATCTPFNFDARQHQLIILTRPSAILEPFNFHFSYFIFISIFFSLPPPTGNQLGRAGELGQTRRVSRAPNRRQTSGKQLENKSRTRAAMKTSTEMRGRRISRASPRDCVRAPSARPSSSAYLVTRPSLNARRRRSKSCCLCLFSQSLQCSGEYNYADNYHCSQLGRNRCVWRDRGPPEELEVAAVWRDAARLILGPARPKVGRNGRPTSSREEAPNGQLPTCSSRPLLCPPLSAFYLLLSAFCSTRSFVRLFGRSFAG